MTARRITQQDIIDNIVGEYYFTAAEGIYGNEQVHVDKDSSLHSLTFCVLLLKNGFTVTGESACVSPENFDEKIGQSIARKRAEDKIWPLMGYELKERLHK